MTIEYQLARITAQSKNADPKQIRGGLATLTADDVRAAVSMVNRPVAYHALMAKYCGSEMSENALMDIMEDASMRSFMREHPGIRINGDIHRRLVECAMIWFMSPEQGRARKDAGNAKHCKVDRKTWVSNYKPHFHTITAFLLLAESTGLADVKRVMYGKE